MAPFLASALVSMMKKLITERFLAKLVIEGLCAWSKTTDTDHDDKVVEAMAEALGIDKIALKEASK